MPRTYVVYTTSPEGKEEVVYKGCKECVRNYIGHQAYLLQTDYTFRREGNKYIYDCGSKVFYTKQKIKLALEEFDSERK